MSNLKAEGQYVGFGNKRREAWLARPRQQPPAATAGAHLAPPLPSVSSLHTCRSLWRSTLALGLTKQLPGASGCLACYTACLSSWWRPGDPGRELLVTMASRSSALPAYRVLWRDRPQSPGGHRARVASGSIISTASLAKYPVSAFNPLVPRSLGRGTAVGIENRLAGQDLPPPLMWLQPRPLWRTKAAPQEVALPGLQGPGWAAWKRGTARAGLGP